MSEITVWDQLTAEQKAELGEKGAKDALRQTVQARVDTIAQEGMPGIWWFTRPSEWEIAPWWSQQRDLDLRTFVKKEGNDILSGAISSMVKKFKAMNWTVEGPQATVEWGQELLAEAEFGRGWGSLLSKVIEDYYTCDNGAFIEVIGPGKPDKELDGRPSGIAHLDSLKCTLTGDPTYPVVFRDAKGVGAHKIHASRVIHLVDMESPNQDMCGVGFSAVSRVVASSQILLKLAQYKREKLDDLPQAGLLVLNNVVASKWDDTVADYERERRKLGNEIWANVMTLFGVDPSAKAEANFLSFSQMPEHFDEAQTTTTYVNIVALALGIDAREIWPVSSGSLGTASESLVMHQKAKGKGVGELISAIERAINWKVFPKRVSFQFDFQDDDEDAQAAAIQDQKVTTIVKMFAAADPTSGETLVSRDEARQMLADAGTYFVDEFLTVDITDDEQADDTEQVDEGESKPLPEEDESTEEKAAERVEPEGNPLPLFRGDTVDISPEDVALAILEWNKRVPDAAGLLGG